MDGDALLAAGRLGWVLQARYRPGAGQRISFRPLLDTVRDTYDCIDKRWREALQPARAGLAAAGPDRECEAPLLAGWRVRTGEVPGTRQE